MSQINKSRIDKEKHQIKDAEVIRKEFYVASCSLGAPRIKDGLLKVSPFL